MGSLAAMLVLAQLDMCTGHCTEFDIHLRAARDLMRLYWERPAQIGFVEQRLIWLDLMSSTTSSRRPAFDLEETIEYLTRAGLQKSPSLAFPCSSEIFVTLASAIHYHKSHVGSNDDKAASLLKAYEFCRTLRYYVVPQTVSQKEKSLTECYRNGALLFINGLFERPSRSEETKEAIDIILRHVDALTSIDPKQNFLLWPLY
ncbi:uncharacterized protein AB675_4375 [Cyphellophora attinorum]|uniref:Transcription factor domain-containing protein n=1 Tax=Cyphellophora attinorum TaxID=1664694 RepID=A0A0N1NYT2_9EURO|nr:uncharacterized protein AB675_4375 [Phialophora attinorum]KPI36552.1 hypothetical protein AB675_4375 [Phialophora attinorum]